MIPKIFQILVLEDNPGDVFLLKKALAYADIKFEMTVIDDGSSGLSFARREGKYADFVPDLAVLDLNLPKGGGLLVLEAMRNSKDLAQLPVVITTSSGAAWERAKGEELKMALFITKPPSLEEYLQIGGTLKTLLMNEAG